MKHVLYYERATSVSKAAKNNGAETVHVQIALTRGKARALARGIEQLLENRLSRKRICLSMFATEDP